MIIKNKTSALLLFLALLSSAFELKASQSLPDQFKNPPQSVRPKTWMHAMSGNMSKEGYTKDLQAIADAGIGGVLLFNVTHTIPEGKVEFNSDEFHQIVKHAAQESERLGLSFGIHNCDGWTSSGGPWVTPEHSMKMVSWSETLVNGGTLDLQLPKPSARNNFYSDIAVIAYPSLPAEIDDSHNKPVVTASDPSVNMPLMIDQHWDEKTFLRASPDKQAWLQFAYKNPKTIRGIFMSLHKAIAGSKKFIVETSDDGIHFKEILRSQLKRLGKREFAIDERITPVSALYFRIVIEDNYEIAEVNLTGRPNYSDYLAQTSLFKIENPQIALLQETDKSLIVNKKSIRDLTKYMNESGRLQSRLPRGQWTILRFGYTTTGATNSPASDAGRGLEVDKMNKASFKIHYDAYVKKVITNVKDVAPKALQYVEIDSFEVGGQNWTQGYEKLFAKEFDYSLMQFLPLYAGRLVESSESSATVLSDIRRLNSKLITENYFGYFTELAHQDNLITYIEPYSFNAPFNELDAGRYADIPMGEFWMHQRYQTGTAVSSGRIYGKNVISAESFSANIDLNWKSHPALMKPVGDKAWTLGINEFMFHRFAHQANTHVKPGMTMSQWGSHIDRTQTWWNNAGKAWFDYIARGSLLLRQGVPASDLLIYVGEGSPNSVTERTAFSPNIPSQINFDHLNTDVLMNRLLAKNKRLLLPEGTNYKALALANTEAITLSTLTRLAEIADQDIVIIGPKPKRLLGYKISNKDKKLFHTLIEKIWSKKTTYLHYDWNKIWTDNNFAVDFSIANNESFSYTHRRSNSEDIYFFINPENKVGQIQSTFNVYGKMPERWNPITGEIHPIANFTQTAMHTQIPLYLQANEAVFIVFREATNNNQAILTVDKILTQKEIRSPWQVEFNKEFGYANSFRTRHLFDWRNSPTFDLQHYSGTANYTTEFDLDTSYFSEGIHTKLDLGDVQITARVFLNGKDLGVLWTPPFVVDITQVIRKGRNNLKIEVTNTWANRLIGDEHYPRTDGYTLDNQTTPATTLQKMPEWYTNNQPMPQGKRQTFTTMNFYKKTDDLVSSGLLGPVTLTTSKIIPINDK